jgi:hypothetical protein
VLCSNCNTGIGKFKDDIDKLYDEKTQIMREFNKRYGEEMYRKRKNPLKDILNMK